MNLTVRTVRCSTTIVNDGHNSFILLSSSLPFSILPHYLDPPARRTLLRLLRLICVELLSKISFSIVCIYTYILYMVRLRKNLRCSIFPLKINVEETLASSFPLPVLRSYHRAAVSIGAKRGEKMKRAREAENIKRV